VIFVVFVVFAVFLFAFVNLLFGILLLNVVVSFSVLVMNLWQRVHKAQIESKKHDELTDQ